MEDWMIVRLLFQRSEEAVAELDRKYGKICSAIAYRILQNREDAEECVNDAFLRTLKKRERAVFILRYWYCFSVSEIADRTGMKANAVRVSLHRTRKKLKTYLAQREG